MVYRYAIHGTMRTYIYSGPEMISVAIILGPIILVRTHGCNLNHCTYPVVILANNSSNISSHRKVDPALKLPATLNVFCEAVKGLAAP